MNKNDVLYDYISGSEEQLNGYAKGCTDPQEFMKEINWYLKEKKELADNSNTSFLAILQPTQVQAGIDYDNMKYEGFDVCSDNYNIVFLRNLPVSESMQRLVRKWHHDCTGESDFYGSHAVTTGDVIIYSCDGDMSSFLVTSEAYRSIKHFITTELKKKLECGLDVRKELAMLQQLSNKNVVADCRQDFIKNAYPKTRIRNAECLTVRHDKKFTEEELYIAAHTDLVDLLSSRGYTLNRVGACYTTSEIDSVRIYNRTTYCRFSDQSGGSAINWLEKIEGMNFVDAVKELLSFNGYGYERPPLSKVSHGETRENTNGDKCLLLPESADNYKQMYAYLVKTRHLDKSTVDYFVNKKLIYESQKHHNIVFLSKDKDGVIRHAFQRGTNTYVSTPFKRDVAGSDKCYGFNVVMPDSDMLVVTEAAIDLMSWYEVYVLSVNGIPANGLALGGCADKPLERFLRDNSHIKEVCLMLDNDAAGDKGTQSLIDKYSMPEWTEKGIKVYDCRLKDDFKDMNERLAAWKKEEIRASPAIRK